MEMFEKTYTTGALQLLNGMRRFTVLRFALADEAMVVLDRLLTKLLGETPYDAAEEYHALSHHLLTGGYARRSGNLFTDYMLSLLLDRKNAFSRAAALGAWDEPLAAAMRQDLTLLDPFFALTSSQLKTWLKEAMIDARTRPRGHKDHIAVLSSAIWSGNTARPLPAATGPGVERKPDANWAQSSFISWRYQLEVEETDTLHSTALEEIIHRLRTVEEHGRLLDDLWNFHATSGTGQFIHERLFIVNSQGELAPVAPPMESPAFSLYEEERAQLLHAAIRFMRDEQADNLFLTGDAGTGKTTMVYNIARELPELRVCCCPGGRLHLLENLFPTLLMQPFKWVLFLDDFDPGDPAWLSLRATFAPTGTQSERLMLIAAARKGHDTFFPLNIHLPAPELKDFMELVQLLLLQRDVDVDFDSIQNACIDYAATAGKHSGSPLNYRSALLIAQLLMGDTNEA